MHIALRRLLGGVIAGQGQLLSFLEDICGLRVTLTDRGWGRCLSLVLTLHKLTTIVQWSRMLGNRGDRTETDVQAGHI